MWVPNTGCLLALLVSLAGWSGLMVHAGHADQRLNRIHVYCCRWSDVLPYYREVAAVIDGKVVGVLLHAASHEHAALRVCCALGSKEWLLLLLLR